MRQGLRDRSHARHLESGLQQRPIEAFAVKGDQHAPLSQPFRNVEQERRFLAVIPHEKLFHHEPFFLPPGDTNQKCVGSRAPGQPGCFRIQKQPLADVADRFAGIGRNEPQRLGTHHFSARLREPAQHMDMSAQAVGPDLAVKQMHQLLGVRRCPCGLPGFRQPMPRTQSRHSREPVLKHIHFLLSNLESGIWNR